TADQLALKWQNWLSVISGTPFTESPDPLDEAVAGIDEDDEDDDEEVDDDSSDESQEGGLPEIVTQQTKEVQEAKEKKRGKRSLGGKKKKKKALRPYEFFGGSDVVGVIFLEVSSITD